MILLRRFVWILLALVAALASAGGATAASFTDSAGRVVEIPDRVERVMAAGPPAAVLLYVLAPEKMLGWVREPTAEEKVFLLPSVRDLPVHGRLTGKGNTASLETVVAMKPDLIIDAGAVDATYASLADRIQQQTGIPYVLIGGRLSDTPQTLRSVAALLGVEERGARLADWAEASLSRAAAAASAVPEGERPRLYYGRGPEGLETAASGSITTEAIDAAGGRNIVEPTETAGLVTVSPEKIVAANPDVIVTLDAHFAEKVRTDPVWSGTAAAQNGRILLAPSLPFGWLDGPPGVNRLIGVEWLVSALYADQGDHDLAERIKVFYELFYHVALTDGQVETLLNPRKPAP